MKIKTVKIKRLSPGHYEVALKGKTVTIIRNRELDYRHGQWICYAEWDRYLISDPVIYLKDAKLCATKILLEHIDNYVQYNIYDGYLTPTQLLKTFNSKSDDKAKENAKKFAKGWDNSITLYRVHKGREVGEITLKPIKHYTGKYDSPAFKKYI